VPFLARVALVIAMAAVPLAAAPAFATYAGRNGELAVVWNQFDRGGRSDWELRLVTPRGGLLQSMAPCSRPETEEPTGSCPRDPSYSADGTRLALELEGRLAVADADGSGLTTLPPLTDRDVEPYWSPGGRRLVFTGTRGGRRNLYLVSPDGSDLRQLTFGGARSPAWSVRGQIAYVFRFQIFRLDSSSGRKVRLARGDNPDWSPSGLSVAYVRRGNLYRVPARRGARRILLASRAREPVFSPDGRRLLFLRFGAQDPGTSVWVARRDGSRARILLEGGEQPVGSTWDAYYDLAWQPLR
jgi:Tol biopolymer transport system component